MKVTVDIPEKLLLEALKFTGAKTTKQAIVKALTAFNRQQRMKKAAKKRGAPDRTMTEAELRRLRETD